jgi:cytochrome c
MPDEASGARSLWKAARHEPVHFDPPQHDRSKPVQSRLMRWLILAALVIAAPAHAADPQAAAEARGAILASRNCSMCHAIGRVGASPNPAAPAFRDLGRRYKVDDLAEALAEGIITGHPAMPEFRFPPAEVNDLIRYLRSIQDLEAASARTPKLH